MKKSWIVCLVVAVAAVSLAACGGTPTPPPTAQATATTTKASQSQAPTATTPPQKAAAAPSPTAPAARPPTATPVDDVLTLTNRAEGLDALKSYRMRWQAQWSTTEGGKSEKGTWDWIEEYSASPQAVHWVWKMTDASGASAGQMEQWQIGDTIYMVTTDQGTSTCMSFSGTDNQVTKGVFSPSSLGSLSGAKYVGAETINGVRTKHYRYSEQNAALVGFSKVTGDVWVAVEGGYVVKDTISWEGSAGPFAAGSQGKGEGSWAWELSDVNKPITIKPPENCGGAARDLPVMPNAIDKTVMGDLISYTTPSKPADVIAFYRTEMAKAGWQVESESTGTPGFATLEFSKSGEEASVTIVASDQTTTVMINVVKR